MERVRRGAIAIADLARSTAPQRSGANLTVAAAAGHTNHAWCKGLTDDYAGRISTNLHHAREGMAKVRKTIPDLDAYIGLEKDPTSYTNQTATGDPVGLGRKGFGKRAAKATRAEWSRLQSGQKDTLASLLFEDMQSVLRTNHSLRPQSMHPLLTLKAGTPLAAPTMPAHILDLLTPWIKTTSL